MKKNILQNIVFPNLTFGVSENMYVRLHNDKVRVALNEKKIYFKNGGKVSFDTFFNGFTVGTWRKYCKLNDFILTLQGNGEFVVRIGIHRIGYDHRWLEEYNVNLQQGNVSSVKLDSWDYLEDGMLYFSLEALGNSTLESGWFETNSKPTNEVKLGIIITHFNRKKYVLPAIERIRNELLNDPLFSKRITLTVVDNSQNLSKEEVGEITLIPNLNLGGSGGFTRGLLQLKEDASYTHCLFMDDDASCEIESIKRAYTLLANNVRDRCAVAGSLLREVEPYRLFEKGARFDGICRPLKSGMDMRNINDLLLAELEDKRPDYGGWWFFAFAINDIKNYAYPFFVRGDDIQFSLLNKFDICTLNGIGCWGDDFGMKSGPFPIYLDVRNHLVQKLCVLNSSAISTVLLATRFFVAGAFSYNYATARAVALAVRDVTKGKSFWLENIDTTKLRLEIAAFSSLEKMRPINRSDYDVVYRAPYESVFRRFFRILTLNGYLLPSCFLKNQVAFQHKDFRGSFREVFLYKKVLYEYEPMRLGYVVEHDKKRFFTELVYYLRQLTMLFIKYKKLKDEYQKALPELTSEAFWRRLYFK